MRTKKSLYTAILTLSAALLSPAEAEALDVKVLSVNTGTVSGNIKAEIIDGEGWTVTNVIGRRYEMATGNCTERNVYRLFGAGNCFISSEVDGLPKAGNDYFFQLEVTFKDANDPVNGVEKVVKTDCFNATMTEGAVWLTDIDRSDMEISEAGTYAIGYDECPNATPGTPIQIHPNSTFGKGISFKATNNPGNVLCTIKTDRRNQYGVPFTYTMFTIGYQAYKANGDASNAFGRLVFLLNKKETGSRANMKAYSTPGRGTGAYYFNQTQANAAGITFIGFNVLNDTQGAYANLNGWEDNYANLAACRLYYPLPAHTKRAQTIIFDNPGGIIFEDEPEAEITAFSTGHTPISYSIIQGKNLATIEERNGEYFLKPLEGKKGTIVVEAITMGDETFDVASATQTYSFNFASSVTYLGTHVSAADPTDRTVYLYIQDKGRTIEKLQLDLYDNVRSFTNLLSADLVRAGLNNYKTAIDNVYAVPVTVAEAGTLVHSLSYKFAGGDEETGGLYEDNAEFIYMTDIPDIVKSLENGTVRTNEAFGGGTLANSKYKYGKGYGVYAPGYIETPESFDLSPFSRFCVDMGGQALDDEGNTSTGRVGYSLYNGISQAYLNTGATASSNVFEWDYRILSKDAGKTIKLEFDAGGDGNADDAICVGSPRFYYPTEEYRKGQSIEWEKEETVNPYTLASMALTAQTSSGLPVIYRIARGAEFGSIVNNNTIVFNVDAFREFEENPENKANGAQAEILVEAIQPGTPDYQAATPVPCVFYLCRTLIIQKDERVELGSDTDVNEIVIYADGKSSGEAVVTDGVVNLKRLVLKYTFTPGKWHHIAFPSDMNLLKVSDLKKKGFEYAKYENEYKPGTFFMREYDGRLRSEYSNEHGAGDPSNYEDGNPWHILDKPEVESHKGYIMKLVTDDDTPVEITFVMQNVSLDFEKTVRAMYLYVDMTNTEPESRHTIYVRPKNVEGNTLRVDLRYVPTDMSQMPLNHAYALNEMRITRTPVRGKIRLMLPEQSPCRVGIYDKKGKKLLKAINYVAPMQIDISDLKPGQYLLTVAYGPAYREMLVDL